MASKRKDHKSAPPRPARTLQGRENQLVRLAVDLAERQLIDGTASAGTITHFLKLGSSRERLEQERLKRENKVLEAKVEAMESNKRIEDLYKSALDAMRKYEGKDDEIEYED